MVDQISPSFNDLPRSISYFLLYKRPWIIYFRYLFLHRVKISLIPQVLVLQLYRVVQKTVYDVIQRKSVQETLKYFLMESFSLYFHILSRSQSFQSYVEKKFWGFKNPENGLFEKSHLIKKDTYFSFFFYFCCKIIVIPVQF